MSDKEYEHRSNFLAFIPGEDDDNPIWNHDLSCDPGPEDHPWPGHGHRYPLCCTPNCPQCKKEGLQ